jgi:hypothetical protein
LINKREKRELVSTNAKLANHSASPKIKKHNMRAKTLNLELDNTKVLVFKAKFITQAKNPIYKKF